MMTAALRRFGGPALLPPSAAAAAAPFAYITNQASHDVSVVDLASDRMVATVPVGRSPAGAAVVR